MGPVRIIILVGAAIAAIALMVIVGGLLSHKPAQAPAVAAAPAKPMTKVVVAAHDLAVGTRIAQADLSWQPWPVDAVNPAFITDGKAAQTAPKDAGAAVVTQTGRIAADAASAVSGGHSPMDVLLGSIVRSPILANEPVTNDKLVRGGDGSFMAVVLKPGMRAIAVPISAASAVGGFILPGDRVDVIQSHAADAASGGASSSTIKGYTVDTLLHNVRVLAIDQSSAAPKNGGQATLGAVATIEVRPEDAETIAMAKARGEMILTLRPYTDAAQPSGGSGGAHRVGVVRIIRNGIVSETTVTP